MEPVGEFRWKLMPFEKPQILADLFTAAGCHSLTLTVLWAFLDFKRYYAVGLCVIDVQGYAS